MNDLEIMTEWSEVKKRLLVVKNLLTIHITDKALIIENQSLKKKEKELKPLVDVINQKYKGEFDGWVIY